MASGNYPDVLECHDRAVAELRNNVERGNRRLKDAGILAQTRLATQMGSADDENYVATYLSNSKLPCLH